VAAVAVPVTLKIRTGWNRQNRNAIRIARIAEDAGIAALSVHGRTRECGYVGPVEYETIRAIKRVAGIPVIANGDIDSPEKAREVLDRTGADAIMIGRAAQGRPWLFREIGHFLESGQRLPPPRVDEIHRLIGEHLLDHYAFYGEVDGVRIARKHLGWYTSKLVGGDAFRARINRLESSADQVDAVDRYFALLAVLGDRSSVGGGGPRSVKRTTRMNGGNEICRSVEKSLEEYFRKLDGEQPHSIYDMVIANVERSLLASVMHRAGGNQTQAADMLGLNRNTLRSKLSKYNIR
jgi:tRNA-dihydrouridine synthase B